MRRIVKRDVWVFVETDAAGRPAEASLQLFTAGRELAGRTKGKLVALCPGDGDMPRRLERLGADRILALRGLPNAGEALTQDRAADAICSLLDRYYPLVLLFADTAAGRDLAPGVAARRGASLAASCDSVRAYVRDRRLVWRRTSFGGDLICTFTGSPERLQVGALRPGAYPLPEETDQITEIIYEDAPASGAFPAMKLPELIQINTGAAVDLESAKVIVAGGRGAGGPEGFRLIGELAELLHGEVAASRVAVDKGWIEKSHLVGQSGKTVKPVLYIACGISGSVQHITGMRDADVVVSINTDPKALIFNVSDYCVVGDMFQILPAWIDGLRKQKGGAGR